MNIGVIGFGTVGKAVAKGFSIRKHLIFINDLEKQPNIKRTSKANLMKNCDFIFVCVPTPKQEDGTINLEFVNSTIKELDDNYTIFNEPIIVIKSSVVPGTTDFFECEFPNLKFVCNPEFLREKHAETDFDHPDRIVIGTSNKKIGYKLVELYKSWNCPIILTLSLVAETIKYIANSLLVAKVSFSCEVAEICKVYGVNAEEVMNAVTLDHRINRSHLDPTLGAIQMNSPCLPKDLLALIKHLESKDYQSSFLQEVFNRGVST